ncbi:MAG: hypothetical protein J0H62_00615 [Rhizobiales bacterium]|nr:hypothetical protein [Hyphomicrobiales bacterium]
MPRWRFAFTATEHERLAFNIFAGLDLRMGMEERKRLVLALEQEIASAENALDETRRKLELLRKLRAEYIRDGAQPLVDGEVPRKRTDSRQQRMIEEVTTLLRGRSDPVHVLDILEHLESKGLKFGGSQPRNALSVLLSRSGIFVASGRRGWRLREA